MSKLKVLNRKVAIQLRPILSKYIITLQEEYKANDIYQKFNNEVFKEKSINISAVQKKLTVEIEKKSGDHDAVELNIPLKDHNELYLALHDVLKEFKYQFLNTDFEDASNIDKINEFKDFYRKLKHILDDNFGNVEGV
ncbi:hypothetical protein [Flammeovirga aprica]|uniref:Uncharacterized protein n=1 Tax=Flammeovirga aprica JL-4 TaxID=694437 RepID=A0A7X9XBB5_9BACT|nr:hypothetical protein [Flammeovirga aprica]NME70555.1 hypothetical protein [Flammeovirga aprica JL-4]